MLPLLRKLFRSKQHYESKYSSQELDSHIDLAVNNFDSRIKLVSAYRKKLLPAVDTALGHIDRLITQIPGPIEISTKAFASDPRVYSYFGSSEQMEHLFSHSREFRAFANEPGSFTLSHGYALMLMSRHEKTVLGHTMKGDMVQSDIMQSVINFSDHKLVNPAESEALVRLDLRERAFQHLVAEAVLKIARQTEKKADLERERVHLQMSLRSLQAEHGALDFVSEESKLTQEKLSRLTRQLADTEQKLAKSSRGLENINDYLELLIDVISQPADYCGLTNKSDCLERHNVKVAAESGSEVPYAEIRIGELKRCGVIVKYPLNEVKNKTRIASKMESIYGN
ncbi:MAG: hypothetical protein ACH253_01720 [Candidatus Thiodiazotropha sp.]